QIAEGLEAAHEAGVIHRDLKPANIRLTPEGKVKVLDFGLAKAARVPEVTRSTDSVLSTEAGRLLGTPTYMAPEQARGKSIDRRIDIWAFGCVLYECLTAKRAFDGETLSDVLSSVLRSEVALEGLPAATPPRVRELLRRCLHKDPRQRLRDIGDARLALEGVGGEGTEPVARASAWQRRFPWSVSALLALLLVLVVLRGADPLHDSGAGRMARHVSLALPDGDELANLRERPFAISPDGTQVVYVGLRAGNVQLYLRPLERDETVPIAGTEGGTSPFFSPDGRWVGFFAQGKLKKVTVGGTALQVLADAPFPRGGWWAPDDTLYFAPTNVSGLSKVPAAGGPTTEVTRLEREAGEISHRWPQVLDDGETLLFSIWTGPGPDEQNLVRQSLVDGTRSVLVTGASAPWFLAPGHLLYGRLDVLYAVPWEPDQEGTEHAVPLALSVSARDEGEGVPAMALSNDGTLVHVPAGPRHRSSRVVWVDRAGKVEPLPLKERDFQSVVLSPDGRQAIVQFEDGKGVLWLCDVERATLTPFATTDGSSQAPVWTPDGKRVIYRGTRKGYRNLFWKAADGTGAEERLTTKADVVQTPTSVSPDGRWVLFDENTTAGGEIYRLSLEPAASGAALEPVLVADGRDGQVSPDGIWLAYISLVTGRDEIYVQPFPGPGPRQPISTGGGKSPLWSRDGKELFYVTPGELLVVDVTTAPTFTASAPRTLYTGRFRDTVNGNTPFSITADGQRFLRVQQVEPERAVTHLDLVLDWRAELERAAAGE
ncbi:MAG: protein kinase, partial [Planctomycetota bacterium]